MAHVQVLSEPRSKCQVHGQALKCGQEVGAYFIYMDCYGIDFLNTLSLGALPVASKDGASLICRSWLNLAWYRSSQ